MGILPFDRLAQVKNQGGTVTAADVPCSPAWPFSARQGRTGQVHDHTAQVALSAVAEVQATNAKLVIDAVTYSIVAADAHDFLPHVECQLRRVRGG